LAVIQRVRGAGATRRRPMVTPSANSSVARRLAADFDPEAAPTWQPPPALSLDSSGVEGAAAPDADPFATDASLLGPDPGATT